MNIDKNREFKEKVIDNDFNLKFQSTKIIKIIEHLQQENTQLKQQLKETNNCLNLQISNVTLLEKELKDKDEKISKVIEYCAEKLKWNRDDGNDYWAGKNNAQQQVSSDIKDILESNKED